MTTRTASSRTKYHIHLVFEELACNILMPVLDYTPVLITIKHSEKDDETEVTASYGGERFNPAESEDGFSYEVLRSMVKSVSYHHDPEAEQANTINVMV